MRLSLPDKQRLNDFLVSIKYNTSNFLGYPISTDFNFTELNEFLRYPLNNLGDPFLESTWRVDSREYEQEVVTFMAKLFRAEKGNFWGYVTNGGSEGNLYGLYLARELYPNGIVYFSDDTHYSVKKNIHLLGMPHVMVRSDKKGEIDYDAFEKAVAINKARPAIFFANIGTTMTEAKDDIQKIQTILDGLSIKEKYIHSDAALCGGLAPFIKPRIPFDFADGADSIAVSGHKSFGSPIPSGIVLARKEHVLRIAKSVDYIGTLDTTITGSRNGLTPLYLWYTIKTLGLEGLRRRVRDALGLADYTMLKLREININAWRNTNSITVVFPKVAESLQEKYQLATTGDITHLILMPGIHSDLVDQFIADLQIWNLRSSVSLSHNYSK